MFQWVRGSGGPTLASNVGGICSYSGLFPRRPIPISRVQPAKEQKSWTSESFLAYFFSVQHFLAFCLMYQQTPHVLDKNMVQILFSSSVILCSCWRWLLISGSAVFRCANLSFPVILYLSLRWLLISGLLCSGAATCMWPSRMKTWPTRYMWMSTAVGTSTKPGQTNSMNNDAPSVSQRISSLFIEILLLPSLPNEIHSQTYTSRFFPC